MSNTSSLMDLLFAGTRQRVLAVLLLQPEGSFHLRELARMTGIHAGTLTRELDKLTEAGLLLRNEQGNQVRYQADRRCPLFEDLSAMFRKTHGAAQLLRDALAPLGERIQLALIFGSTSRGTQSEGSDIDLLVVGELGFADLVRALNPAQEAIRREVNPVLYSAEEMRQRVQRGDGFVRQITSKPVVFLVGDKDDLAKLAGDQAASSTRR